MILIYSATLSIKFQGEFSTLFGTNNSAPVSASVETCGEATGKLRRRELQDHENTTLIQNGDAHLSKSTIETPTIQRKVQS